MIEIVPNWHPVFVHFTVALFSLSVMLYAVTPFVASPLKDQWRVVARWALWFGAGFTVLTALSGLNAYNSVAHDTPSHAAMTDHRNWALATITLFAVLTLWSILSVRRRHLPGVFFTLAVLVAGGVLASTAWRGGEVVYRHGLGVMSLPKSEEAGYDHAHGESAPPASAEQARGASSVDDHHADGHDHVH